VTIDLECQGDSERKFVFWLCIFAEQCYWDQLSLFFSGLSFDGRAVHFSIFGQKNHASS
jgi:hypothetical protein